MSDLNLTSLLKNLDEEVAAHLAVTLDQACRASTSWHEVSSHLPLAVPPAAIPIKESPDEHTELSKEVVLGWAFQYLLSERDPRSTGLRDVFVPLFSLGNGNNFPPLPADLPEPVLTLWQAVTPHAQHPAARGRLSDLLFCAGASPGENGRTAIDAYLKISEVPWNYLSIVDGLLRAAQLARGIGDDQRLEEVRYKILLVARATLDGQEGPGVVLPLLEALAGQHSGYRPEASELLRGALVTYKEPHTQDHIVSLLLTLSDDEEERRALKVERVRVWLAAANSATQMVRVMHLETAVRLADGAGDDELRRDVRQLLQEAAQGDLGMVRSSHSIQLPNEVVEEYLRQFTDAPSWKEALEGFAHHPPVTGTIDETRRVADAADKAGPFQAIIPPVVVGGDGLPRWRPETDQERQDARLARHETLRLQLASGLLALGLERIADTYGVPDRASLVTQLSSRPNLTSGTSDILADSFLAFWSKDYSGAVHRAIWQIEALSRNLLLQVDQGIYNVQRESRPGQYPGLGFLLRRLLGLGLDESWYRYLWTVFASPAGLNLRNEVAHGFIADLGAPLTAVTLHAANYLTTISVTPTADVS